jgi:NADPH:quinone reductase
VFTHATVFHALHDAGRIQAGRNVADIWRRRGIGSAAIGLGRAFGAKVIAGASTQQKVDFAMAAGARAGLTYDSDLQTGNGQRAFAATLKELAPGGLDLVLDPVGGPYTEPAMRRLSRGGRHLVVGFAAEIPRVPLNIALLRSCQIIAVDWRTFVEHERPANEENLKSLFAMWQRERIHPTVTEQFPFEEAPAAIARAEARRAIGKIVVSFHA